MYKVLIVRPKSYKDTIKNTVRIGFTVGNKKILMLTPNSKVHFKKGNFISKFYL